MLPSGIIKDEIAGVQSTPLFLINTVFTGGKHRVTTQTISKICSVEGCDQNILAKNRCSRHYVRPGKCLIEGYEKPPKNRGWCRTHAARWERHGDPTFLIPVPSSEERLWASVDKTPGLGPHGDCWEWRAKTVKGYGVLSVDGDHVLTHRYSFFLANGYWPQPMCLHSCDNPPCINPDHLREGDVQANADDMVARHRHPIGAQKFNAVINNEIARQIKILLRDGYRNCEIRDKLQVHYGTVKNIKRGKAWKHVRI